MKIYRKKNSIQQFLDIRRVEKSVGFIPTMGALHAGHIQLIKESKDHCDITVVSIFVNSAQFNNAEDLKHYPRTIAKDIQQLIQSGCDVLFYPEAEEIYPDDENTVPVYPLGALDTVLEGRFRPGHFQGVARVIDLLFKIVHPNKVFFGQKDYQQCRVIEKLMAMIPEFKNIQLHIVPTMRESSGLAMSSRNIRLSDTEKEKATLVYHSLLFLKNSLRPGNLNPLLTEARRMLKQEGFSIDYISIADAKTLEPITTWDGKKELLALVAVFLGDVRLIDNISLSS